MSTNNIIDRIQKLKQEKNAIILAHNYQNPEVQDIADFVGDSFELSRKAATTDADMIVFCGVYFMAETAKILSPQKTVIIPDKDAGCPMADMVDVAALKELQKEYPDAVSVAYVNSTAEVKAEVDVCCTSGNAIKIINALPEDKDIIFVPDKYLGDYIARETGKKIIFSNGFCPTHVRILPEHILKLKTLYPNAEVMVHPECRRDVIDIADHAFSTAGMVKYAKESITTEFIVGTDNGMAYRLQKENPDKKFYHVCDEAICPNMKRITLEKVLWAFEEEAHEVILREDIINKAKIGLTKMLEITENYEQKINQ